MPTIIQYKGYSIYFTSHCVNEPIHFHINKGAPIEAGSAKIWILSNGEFRVVTSGAINNTDLKKLLTLAYVNKQKIIDRWYSMRGNVSYIE